MQLNERISWAGLPRMDINTLTNSTPGFTPFSLATLDSDKDTKRSCSATFTDQYGSNFFPGGLTTNITIKGRGNSTWLNFPKKPYNIVICGTADFTKRSLPMLGMPADSDWTLLADYDDYTQSRAMFSSAIAYALGQPWASRSDKIEVYFNGAYYGLYTFCEKVTRTAQRINITKLSATDVAAPAVTGGYVLEGTTNNSTYLGPNDKFFLDARFNRAYSYKVPDPDAVVDAQNSYAAAFFNDFQTRLYTQPFTDLVNGYRGVADADSLAQYFLVQDIIKNVDYNSFYLTKDRSGVLKGGPFWDAGFALGYMANGVGDNPENVFYQTTREFYVKLLEDAYFTSSLKTQFLAAMPKIHQAIADMRDYGAVLHSAATADGTGKTAIQREAVKWQGANLAFPINYEIRFPTMLKFIKDRMFWQYRRWYFPLTAQHATVKT